MKAKKLLFLIVIISLCKCEDPLQPPYNEPKNNYLIVGDTIDNKSYSRYLSSDSIISNFGIYYGDHHYSLSIASNYTIDFHTYYHAHSGGELDIKYSKIILDGMVQIASDTSMKKMKWIDWYTGGLYDEEYRKILSPLKMKIGDTISKSLYWVSDSILILSTYKDITNPQWLKEIYTGWSDNKSHYLGIRIIDEDTIYGWLKLKCYGYNNIVKQELLTY